MTPSELPPGMAQHFGDLFGELFGHPSPARARTRDLLLTLPVELSEASEGGHRTIEISRFFACTECEGRGAPEDAVVSPCRPCEGRGSIDQQQGLFSIRTQCAQCQGHGEQQDPRCSACDGQRGEVRDQSLSIRIPGGATEGQVLTIEGKGNELADGAGPGDLQLKIRIGSDPRFERDGDDLRTTVRVGEPLARDGGTTRAPVPHGEVDVEVPPNTVSGATARLVGYGALKLGSPPVPRPTGKEVPYRSVEPSTHRGDLLVTFVLDSDVPSDATHYATLGLPAGASAEEIKSAYRRIAMACHPDRNPGDAEAAQRFEAASAAYSALATSLPLTSTDDSEQEPSSTVTLAVAVLVLVVAITWFLIH